MRIVGTLEAVMSCSGVRNRLYESHLFKSTLVWRKTDWTVAESSVTDDLEMLKIVDPNDGSSPSESQLTIEYRSFNGGDARFRVLRETFEWAMSRADGTHSVVHAPSHSALRAEGRTERNGATYMWEIDCPKFEKADSHVVVFFHESLESAGTRRNAMRDVVLSLRRATPNAGVCHPTGVIEVERAIFDLADDPVTVTLELTNVDDKDAVLEYGRLRVVSESFANGVVTNTEFEPDDPGGSVTVPVDETGTAVHLVSVKFTVTDVDEVSHIIYKHDTRDIRLGNVNDDTNGPGRPRINPGG